MPRLTRGVVFFVCLHPLQGVTKYLRRAYHKATGFGRWAYAPECREMSREPAYWHCFDRDGGNCALVQHAGMVVDVADWNCFDRGGTFVLEKLLRFLRNMNKASCFTAGRFQTSDKPCKCKNPYEWKERRKDFCLLCQQHLQAAVTYVHVSSLDCKFASLPCRLFQALANR